MIRGARLLANLTPVGSLILLVCAPVTAQSPVRGSEGNVRIVNTDMAILETQDVRTDLPCTVTPRKPVLGFDLKFHAGYDVAVPLKELSGAENQLTVLFRVTPDNRKDDPSYFVQHIRVPSLEEDTKGDANLEGQIDLGEGTYHVDWLMRDRGEHVCSFYWDMDASLASKDKQMELALTPNHVDGPQFEQFKDEPPVARSQAAPPLSIKLLVNFGP